MFASSATFTFSLTVLYRNKCIYTVKMIRMSVSSSCKFQVESTSAKSQIAQIMTSDEWK